MPYKPTEDSQDPPKVTSSTQTLVEDDLPSLIDLPRLFDSLENFSTLHHQHNFLVLAPSSPDNQVAATDSSAQEEVPDGEAETEVRRAVKPSAHVAAVPKAPLKSTTGSLENVSSPAGVQLPVHKGLQRGAANAIATAVRKSGSAVLDVVTMTRVPAWVETVVVIIGLIVSFVAHAFNMFNFPRYELDEGTYMSSAWAIMNGMITPYPYGYGHPPLAWIQIAGWIQVTGGFFTFGNAINSGRVLMLLYALGSSCLVYLIVRHMSGSRSIGVLALVLFSLSPLSLVYQRQVLLDNISTFWLLLSLYLIVAGKSRLLYIVFAAIAFGISLLSKEVFLLFTPTMIYAIWLYTTKYQRKFGLVTFTYTIVAIGFCFILMAILKDELFPYAWHLPWDHHPHLSMLDTFMQQAQRGQSEGRFVDSWYTWSHGDPLVMMLGIVIVGFNLLIGWWKRKNLLLSLLAISYWFLLVRGGVVLSFYIIPLIPLVVLNTALAVHTVGNWIGKLIRLPMATTLLALAIVGVVVPYDLQYAQIAFTQHPTSAQTDAMVWVRNTVPRTDVVVINSYLYMDLREPGGQGVGDGATYPYAHVYWNVAYDPELHDQLLQNNWDRIDYIVADSEMLHDITTVGGPMSLINNALQHSLLRAEFRAYDHDKQIVISIYQVIHKQSALHTV